MNQTADARTPPAVMQLWHLQKQDQDASCELARISVGYEGRFFLNGHFLYSYQFTDIDEALAWAFSKRADFRAQGWYLKLSSLSVAS